MNREVNLTKRAQTTRGWRYCTVVLSANGRVKPDLILVNGEQETHQEGAYYLEWREGSKRVRLSVGKDPADKPIPSLGRTTLTSNAVLETEGGPHEVER
jgi:hypothetical protein